MPLMPKRTKHRKMQKGRMRGKATRGNKVTDGEYGIQAVTGALVTGNQIEAAENADLEREKRMQKAMIDIKKKFGKNAILKGMNLEEGATAKDRNEQIGGHKA